jgi:dUTP pyrophosphatase
MNNDILIKENNSNVLLKYWKLHENVKDPIYATPGSACFDIHAYIQNEQKVYLYPGCTHIFNTGLIFDIPEGYCLQIYSRSGMGFNDEISLINSVGIIDSDYKKEVKIKLCKFYNEGSNEQEPTIIINGDRIAQGMLVPVQRLNLSAYPDLNNLIKSERGGFGSTGR